MPYVAIRRFLTGRQSPNVPPNWLRRPSALEPSPWIVRAFDLDRYSPAQRREILRLIARRKAVGQGDIVAAVKRVDRRAVRLRRACVAVIVLALAMTVGLLVVQTARYLHRMNGAAEFADSSSAANPPLIASGDNPGPGGLDAADKAFFADLAMGKIDDTSPPPRVPVRTAIAAPAAPVAPAASAASLTRSADAGAPVIQLGAFADAAIARTRWQSLSGQFPPLRPLTQSITGIARDGHIFYRLRASGADAANACSMLAAAGIACFVTSDAG